MTLHFICITHCAHGNTDAWVQIPAGSLSLYRLVIACCSIMHQAWLKQTVHAPVPQPGSLDAGPPVSVLGRFAPVVPVTATMVTPVLVTTLCPVSVPEQPSSPSAPNTAAPLQHHPASQLCCRQPPLWQVVLEDNLVDTINHRVGHSHLSLCRSLSRPWSRGRSRSRSMSLLRWRSGSRCRSGSLCPNLPCSSFSLSRMADHPRYCFP